MATFEGSDTCQMLFNSIDFALFLPLVFVLYWFVANKRLSWQNTLVVLASYVFYGWWDWRFLSLIVFSTLVDFSIGQKLATTQKTAARKRLLALSILVNIGLLGFFKYYNFFVENFVEAFRLFGMELEISTLQIILPVGISFYTFQTLSYTIDVYRRKLAPINDPIAFAAFVAFFPQLVAGPIERATHLLPQFVKQRTFNYSAAYNGMRQILWGLFKKMVVADNCAYYVDIIFDGSGTYSGSTLFLGAALFAFQIYGDFSGYSDIAIGTSRLFGFDLKQNFNYPYFARDIAEFWRRWHISLSTWFRDYLYIPLGGSRGSTWIKIRNVFIIFLVSGFWHGANWTFIIWGGLHALFFLPLILSGRNRRYTGPIAHNRYLPGLREGAGMLLTFVLTTLAWVFFRAENLSHAMEYFGNMASVSLISFPQMLPKQLLVLIMFLLVIEWLGRHDQYALEKRCAKWPKWVRLGFYYILIGLIFFMGRSEQDFIYFQF